MFPDADQQDFIAVNDHFNHDSIADIDGNGRKPIQSATVCEAYQRSRLERLCRYITRPPIATKRLSVEGRGRVVYRYKQPFRDGSTHVVLEPLSCSEF